MVTIVDATVHHTHGNRPVTLTYLGHREMSPRFIEAVAELQRWPNCDRVLAAFIAAEALRRNGIEAYVVDCISRAHFIVSEDDDTMVAGRPDVTVGTVPVIGGHSNNAVVLANDRGRIMLVDMGVDRLRHPEFPVFLPIVAGTTHYSLGAVKLPDGSWRQTGYQPAAEWLVRAPSGGIVMVSWRVQDGEPSWASREALYRQQARAIVGAERAARISAKGIGFASVTR